MHWTVGIRGGKEILWADKRCPCGLSKPSGGKTCPKKGPCFEGASPGSRHPGVLSFEEKLRQSGGQTEEIVRCRLFRKHQGLQRARPSPRGWGLDSCEQNRFHLCSSEARRLEDEEWRASSSKKSSEYYEKASVLLGHRLRRVHVPQ